MISRLGTGTDKIDVETATQKDILVTNVPDFCVEEQADHNMALIIGTRTQIVTNVSGNGREGLE